MRLPFLILAILPLVISVAAKAADQNGYTANYEKRIGTPPPCSITISSAKDSNWEKLNDPSVRVICLRRGDYTSRGTIKLTASGTSGDERWLRLQSSDDQRRPINQSLDEQAKIKRLVFEGANYWVIHRIVIDGSGASHSPLIELMSNAGSTNNIIDSVLAENSPQNIVVIKHTNNGNTVQNSVLRRCKANPSYDFSGVALMGGPTNTRIVNNEIYECQKAVYISEHRAEGTVIENNDLYFTTNQYTDCKGHFNRKGPCSASEVLIGTKNGGTSTNPVRIIQNRLWGARRSDTSVCCASGSHGKLISLSSNGRQADPDRHGAKYTLVQNNILMDAQIGLDGYWAGIRNNSVIGNLFYRIRAFYPTVSHAIGTEGGYTVSSEYYLNTIIDSDIWFDFGGSPENDVRCNVVINGGEKRGKPGSNTQVVQNAFYNTEAFSTASTTTDIEYSNAADANSLKFCFKRKLLTGPEQICIPYAKPIAQQTPHMKGCDSNLGARRNIGVSDGQF
jgi:hypothetical protein